MTTLSAGLHPPHSPRVELLNEELAVARFGEASIFARTVADAEALILAGVQMKDLLLAAQEPAPQCLTCGATTDLDAVHVRAREGIAARVEWYCHDTAKCQGRRHPEVASLVAQHGTAGAS